MPRVSLITGAAGFAGGHLLAYLASIGEHPHAWVHRGAAPAASGAASWTAVDLLDRAAVRRGVAERRPSVIYHCAGAAAVGDAWQSPAHALQVNALGTHHLLDAVRQEKLDCRVLVTGSAQIYQPSEQPLSEDAGVGPANPYGVSKLAQEIVARESGVPVWLARPFNHAGPRQSDAFATSAFARQLAEIEAGRREPVLHVGNLEARRDITDVRDTVRAYHALVERGRTGVPYNVCTGRAYSVRDLLNLLCGFTTAAVRVEIDPARLRPSDNPLVVGTHTRLTAETGWTPSIPIELTLKDLLEDWRQRLA